MKFLLIMTLMVTELGPVNITTVEVTTADLSTEKRCERAAIKWLSEIPPPRHAKQLINKTSEVIGANLDVDSSSKMAKIKGEYESLISSSVESSLFEMRKILFDHSSP